MDYFSSMKCSLLVAGATGLVGSAVVDLALTDARFGRVINWARRPVPQPSSPIEHWGPVNGDLSAGLRPEQVDAVICCLGTTIRAVKGDKKAFMHVDKDLVLDLGRWASGKGVRFCVVSAMGANPRSMIFYNRVKGEMEAGLRKLDFAALHLFHPSILDGARKDERTGERLGLAVMRAIAPILPAASRPMPINTLAKALIEAAISDVRGTHVHTYREILELAR